MQVFTAKLQSAPLKYAAKIRPEMSLPSFCLLPSPTSLDVTGQGHVAIAGLGHVGVLIVDAAGLGHDVAAVLRLRNGPKLLHDRGTIHVVRRPR